MSKFNRRLVLIIGGAGILSLIAGSAVNASPFDKLTLLVFSRAVAVPGATLEPGEYAFSLANPHSGRNVVMVSNRQRTRTFALAMTRQVPRPPGSHDAAIVTLGESPAGTPQRVTAWYPAGGNAGYEFIY